MKENHKTTLFLDIGGVLLSNGWGHEFRYLAAKKFNLDIPEMEKRHSIVFTTYEEGRISLTEYLNRVVFYKNRDFTADEFRDFMFSLTTPHEDMITLIKGLRQQYGLKIVVISNEARDLNEHRIQKFGLNKFVDFFITSCYVQLRKPDTAIFQMALDGAQVPIDEIVYIDDVQSFVEIATDLGITSIQHKNFGTTSKSLG